MQQSLHIRFLYTFYLLCIYQCTHVTQPLYKTYSINPHTITLLIHALSYYTHTVFKHHAPTSYNTHIQVVQSQYPFMSLYIYAYTIHHTNLHTFILSYISHYIHISHIISRITHVNIFQAIYDPFTYACSLVIQTISYYDIIKYT